MKLDDIEEKLIFLQAPTNTGKTTLFTDYLLNNLKENYLVVSFRRLLCYSMYDAINSRLENVKSNERFSYYKNEINKTKQIVQVDSIIHIKPEIYKDCVLVLDEIHAILKHLFLSTTLKNKQKEIFGKFTEILKNAKKVICMDADLLQMDKSFIEDICACPSKTLINKYKNYNGYNCYLMNEIKQMYGKLYEDIFDNNQYPFVCSNSATDIKEVRQNIINERQKRGIDIKDKIVMFIASDCDETMMSDIKEKWRNKIILYSPLIISGIDYNDETPRNVYGIYKRNDILDAYDMNQQISRCRNIKSLNLLLPNTLLQDKFYSPEGYLHHIQTLIKNNKEHLDDYNLSDDDVIEDTFNKYRIIFKYHHDYFIKSRTKEELTEILQHKGFEIKLTMMYADKYKYDGVELLDKDEHKALIQFREVEVLNEIIKKIGNEEELKEFEEKIIKRCHILNIEYSEMIKYKDYITNDRKFVEHLQFSRFLIKKEILKDRFKERLKKDYLYTAIECNDMKLLALKHYEEQVKINTLDFDNIDENIRLSTESLKYYKRTFRQHLEQNKPKYNYLFMVRSMFRELFISERKRTKDFKGTLYSINQEYLDEQITLIKKRATSYSNYEKHIRKAYDLKQNFVQLLLDTISTAGSDKSSIVLKQRNDDVNTNAGNVQQKKKYFMGKIDTDNVHKNFIYTQLQNKNNIKSLQKIKINIVLPNPNFELYRFQPVEIVLYDLNDMQAKAGKSDNSVQQTINNENRINNRLSGKWL
jgi:hypothetical protein